MSFRMESISATFMMDGQGNGVQLASIRAWTTSKHGYLLIDVGSSNSLQFYMKEEEFVSKLIEIAKMP